MVKEKIIAVYSNWNYFSELSIIVIKGNEHIYFMYTLFAHMYISILHGVLNKMMLSF